MIEKDNYKDKKCDQVATNHLKQELKFMGDLNLYAKNEKVWSHLFRQFQFSVMILP